MESEFDFCARRAAEEFIAAGRAATEAERSAHRALAEGYSAIVRLLLRRRADRSTERPSFDPASGAEAA